MSERERDGDPVVCAVWNAPEPVSVQDRGPDARSGGVSGHRRGGVAVGRCVVLL